MATFDQLRADPGIIMKLKSWGAAHHPREACAALTPGGLALLANHSPAPTEHFDCDAALAQLQIEGSLLAVWHTHPARDTSLNGLKLWDPRAPSQHDMAQQIAMNVPWGISVSGKTDCSDPWWWGDGFVPPVPLIGRGFRSGPTGTDGNGDCYALIKDWYSQERGIVLADNPRGQRFWNKGQDLYAEGWEKWGFRVIPPTERRQPGDVAMMAVRSSVINHAALWAGEGVILHHLENRLSQRVSVIEWKKLIRFWVRHKALGGER